MAVRYAVATGNWSNTATWNGGTLPTSADDVYANGFTVTIDQDVTVLSIQTSAQSPAVAGGGFILNSGLNVTANGLGVRSGSSTCITYSALSGTSTINANIFGSTNTSSINCIIHSASGTLNIIGNLNSGSSGGGNLMPALSKTGTGILNIIGNLIVTPNTNSNHSLVNSGTGTINITGNIFGQSGPGSGFGLSNSGICTINITGSVFAGSTGLISGGITNTVAATFFITGNVYSNNGNAGFTSTAAHYLNIIGTTSSGFLNSNTTTSNAVVATSTSAINILTGPFISSTYGVLPIYVSRMHYFRTSGSYFEFRDNSTDGALSPGAIASASRLVSPDTVIDAPSPSNVRFGTTYASGSMTGTMQVPAAQNVQYGVLVDNTVGTATLQPSDIWNTALTNISASNSIGVRIKNAATVETVGAQLQSLLNG